MASHCEKHNKEYEIFCMECGGIEESMCSICICEHNLAKHFKGNVHMKSAIQQKLVEVGNGAKQAEVQQKKLDSYIAEAEEGVKKKDAIKLQIDKKLEEVKE